MVNNLIITLIRPADRPAVASFVRSMMWEYEHFDYSRGEALSFPGYQARDKTGKLVGVLGCGMDCPPVARVLYAAAASFTRPREVIGRLLEPNQRDMQDIGATELTFLGLAPWLEQSLEEAGFVIHTTVVSYQRRGWDVPATGNARVHLRPASAADADVLSELDRAAFEPMWRYPANLHRRMLTRSAHCIVAEWNGQPVAYQISDIRFGQGQIARLVVRPEMQGQGIGTRLLADAVAFFQAGAVQRMVVNTQSDNHTARHLYEWFGFTRFGDEVPALVKPLRPEFGGEDDESGEAPDN